MKILLTTIGSRGDIQPYIALAIGLQKSGHEVKIATHPWAASLIEHYHLSHVPVGKNIDIHYAARQFVQHSTNPIQGMRFALNFIFDQLRACHRDFLNVMKDAEAVIGHGIVGQAEADILDKPFVSVSIDTMGLRKEYWKSNNIPKELGIFLFDTIGNLLFGGPYKKFMKEMAVPSNKTNKKQPYLALVPISPSIQKAHPNWKHRTEITGYLFADAPDHFKPPEALTDFIHSGEKPLLFTFGSMFHQENDTRKLYQTLCKSLTQTGQRALLIMPDLDRKSIETPNNLFITENIPYSWLLKQVSAVIHHFGFGTSAEVLKSGIPSVPLPHIFDQNMRAKEIYQKGLATKPLNPKHINSQQLTKAIEQAKSDQKLISRCRETGERIARENGVEKAVECINKYLTEK